MRNMTFFTGIIADIRDRQIRTNGAGIDMLRAVSQYPRVYAKPSLRWHLRIKQSHRALLLSKQSYQEIC